MWIRSIDIADFGILQRARLSDLGPGLNVVCGPQRAGKTTFMQALRYLGYGFPRTDDIPPAVDAYDITADIVHEDEDWRITTQGHAEPRLVAIDGDRELSAREVFHMDPFQYRQLFTISLDELRRIPHGLDKDEKEDLTAVLLGAGWADVLQIPEVAGSIERGWNQNLGGVNGTAYEMGTVLETIEEWESQREEATEQVEEYRRTVEKIQEKDEELEALQQAIDEGEQKALLLRTVEDNLEPFRRLRDLQRELSSSSVDEPEAYDDDLLEQAGELKQRYEEAAQGYEDAIGAFERESSAEYPADQRERLLANEDILETYNQERSGWRQRVDRLADDEEEVQAAENGLRREVRGAFEGWEQPSDVESVRTDLVSEDRIQQAVAAYERAWEALDGNRDRREELESEIEKLERQADQAPAAEAEGPSARAVGWGLAGVAIAAALGAIAAAQYVSPLLAGAITAGVLILAFFLLVPKLGGAEASGTTADAYRQQIPGKRTTLDTLEDKEDELETELASASEELDTIQEELGIPVDVSANGLQTFYEQAAELQSDLEDVRDDRSKVDEERKALTGTLAEVSETLSPIVDVDWDPEAPIAESQALLDGVEEANQLLERAKRVEEAEDEKESCEREIEELIETNGLEATLPDPPRATDEVETELEALVDEAIAIDDAQTWTSENEELAKSLEKALDREQIKQALEPYREPGDPDPWTLAAFERASEGFADTEAVAKQLNEVRNRVSDIREEKEQRQGERGELVKDRKDLATDEKLQKAQQKINEANSKLEPMAERWATLRISEKILDRLYDRFVEQAAGPLLREASQTFQRLTGEDYTKLSPGGDIQDLETTAFHAHRPDGDPHTTNELSRATREQLFLAVRLARIRQLDPPLPVILDDSTTNFDPSHQMRALEAVMELADTHQVFLMTCHPELIDRVEASATNARYYHLVEGAFEGPFQTGDPAKQVLLPRRG